MWRPSACRGDGEAALRRATLEVVIPADESDLRPKGNGARQVDSVISAQLELLGKLPGLPCQWRVNPHQQQLILQRLELRERASVGAGSQPPSPTSAGKRRPTLGVVEDAASRPQRRAPQFARQLRTGLDDDELDERGGVEIKDQRRCSAIRSETESRAPTLASRPLR